MLFAAGLGLTPALWLLGARGAELDVKTPAGTPPPKVVKPVRQPPPPVKDEEGVVCGKHGTTVEFADSPSEAARQARKEQKLVFVLHVSGHFEDSGVT